MIHNQVMSVDAPEPNYEKYDYAYITSGTDHQVLQMREHSKEKAIEIIRHWSQMQDVPPALRHQLVQLGCYMDTMEHCAKITLERKDEAVKSLVLQLEQKDQDVLHFNSEKYKNDIEEETLCLSASTSPLKSRINAWKNIKNRINKRKLDLLDMVQVNIQDHIKAHALRIICQQMKRCEEFKIAKLIEKKKKALNWDEADDMLRLI
jgi:hypothetical protein